METATLGYTLENGTEVNLQIGVRDWDAMCGVVEDTLLTMHKEEGHTEDEMPKDDIMAAAYCVRRMREELVKLDAKVDQLIDENMELAQKLDTAVNGINAVVEVNHILGGQNEELRQRLQQYEGSQNAPE